MVEGGEEYKEMIKQCISGVKEVFGEGRFDDVVASVLKMQEKVLASSAKEGAYEGEEESLYEALLREMKVIKKRILRLEKAVLGSTSTSSSSAAVVSSSEEESAPGG